MEGLIPAAYLGAENRREPPGTREMCSAQRSILCSFAQRILVAQLSERYPCLLCSVKRPSTPNPPGPHLSGKALSVQCVHGPATMPFVSP